MRAFFACMKAVFDRVSCAYPLHVCPAMLSQNCRKIELALQLLHFAEQHHALACTMYPSLHYPHALFFITLYTVDFDIAVLL